MGEDRLAGPFEVPVHLDLDGHVAGGELLAQAGHGALAVVHLVQKRRQLLGRGPIGAVEADGRG